METKVKNDAKQVFRNCGTCSRTFAHILNREFGHIQENEEKALNPLAGGIMNEGYQCGMLWGVTLAIGAESYRRHNDLDSTINVAISTTQKIIESFSKRTGTVNCRDIIGYELNNTLDMAKFMLKITLQGMNNSHCFNLAEVWAPEAIQAATEGVSSNDGVLKKSSLNCASEVVRRMGGNNEEIAMVAGFAGGLGLSGNACGALSAAIWKRMLDWCRENPDKNPPFYNNKTAKKILKVFIKETNGVMLCSNICGRRFSHLDEHAHYIKNDGCKKLIDKLVNA